MHQLYYAISFIRILGDTNLFIVIVCDNNLLKGKQAFREFLVSPALIRNYKAVISISFI